MLNKILIKIAYILVEFSFRLDKYTDDYFDVHLYLKPDSPIWVKIIEKLSWQLYHNGCWFYSFED